MSQCKVEVLIHKGIGYTVRDTYRTKFYCLAERGHDGPHVISDPSKAEDFMEQKTDEHTGLTRGDG